MQSQRRASQRGQIILMSTLSLTVVFGMVGIAVEVGWAMYIRTLAQSAADAAALGAASQALSTIGQTAQAVCGVSVRCQAGAGTELPASFTQAYRLTVSQAQ